LHRICLRKTVDNIPCTPSNSRCGGRSEQDRDPAGDQSRKDFSC
jgi:hypothetical protein